MLGRIYQDLGQNEKAIQHLEMYLELDSDGYQAQNARRMLNQLKPPESGATEQ
jgi:regulator of sirC expression with transglutaminase-like and TPR domain